MIFKQNGQIYTLNAYGQLSTQSCMCLLHPFSPHDRLSLSPPRLPHGPSGGGLCAVIIPHLVAALGEGASGGRQQQTMPLSGKKTEDVPAASSSVCGCRGRQETR